jgi:hypothetical protein
MENNIMPSLTFYNSMIEYDYGHASKRGSRKRKLNVAGASRNLRDVIRHNPSPPRDCTIQVAKETGQGKTIVYENLAKMMSRMFAGSFGNSVWVCHQTTIPQLLQLSLAVGTGGAPVPVLNQANGQFTMLTGNLHRKNGEARRQGRHHAL